MDQLILDATHVAELEVGSVCDPAGPPGGGADRAGGVESPLRHDPWEILCGFKHRLPRLAVDQLRDDAPPEASAG